jgi:ArsR family transcriptional regulator
MNTDSLAALFKTLSETVRLRIIFLLLSEGELCVCELVDTLNLSQSVVSRHLAYLRNNGLVTARREGVWVHYKIVDDCCSELFQHIRQCGENNAEMQEDLAQLAAARQSCCDGNG